MNRVSAFLVVGTLALAGCGGGPETQAAEGMTAEEHARMLAGESTGAMDTVGAAVRQPVHLTADQARAIGVTFTVVERGPLARLVRTVGQVVPAEPKLAEITTKIDGFVERLFVDATGASVRRGQPLLTLYSPMLVAAQEELLAAKRLASVVDSTDREAWRNAQALVEASRRRLSYWDISAEQIERLARTGEVTKTLTLDAPFNGIVLDKMVVQGQAVMPGMKLYRLADLSTVWIEAAVFEQDLAHVRVGAPVRADFAAYPGRLFSGSVSFVWPTVDTESRSTRVRVASSASVRRAAHRCAPTLRSRTKPGVASAKSPAAASDRPSTGRSPWATSRSAALHPAPSCRSSCATSRCPPTSSRSVTSIHATTTPSTLPRSPS